MNHTELTQATGASAPIPEETGIQRHWREQAEAESARRLSETPGTRIQIADRVYVENS